MTFVDILAYSIGCSLPWGGIGILVFLAIRKKTKEKSILRYAVNSVPAIAGGLGSWTGFSGESILFPLLTGFLWGGITFLAVNLRKQPENKEME